MEEVYIVQKIELIKLVKEICLKHGLPEQDASLVSDCLVETNLRGIDTHGVALLEPYVERLKAGSLNPSPSIRQISNAGPISVVDGDNGMGQIVGAKAMNLAIEDCRDNGIGLVGVCNSNHFGAAGYFSMMALSEGFIGVALTNASPRLAPWGGITPVYGNNPISIAIPWDFPIVIDMANSMAAFGKIHRALNNNESIPEGWAMDLAGNAVTDPKEAKLLMPIGNHKGYILAFAVEVLAGILTGAAFGKEVGRHTTLNSFGQNVGHFFMAISIESFIDKKEFNSRLSQFIVQIRSSELAAGIEKVYLPGEIEHLTKIDRLEKGIPVKKEIFLKLKSFID